MTEVLAICCGGAGFDQTWEIQQALAVIGNVHTASAGGWDGYKTNLMALIAPVLPSKLVIVSHSFGCETALQTGQYLANQGIAIDYFAMLDPVSYSPFWAKTIPFIAGALPKAANLWYSQFPLFVRPAQIPGAPPGTTIDGTDHNSLCHVQTVIAAIVSQVTRVSEVSQYSDSLAS